MEKKDTETYKNFLKEQRKNIVQMGNSAIDFSETGLIGLEKEDSETYKKFLDEPMFVINTEGYVSQIKGDAHFIELLTNLGLIVFEKSDMDDYALDVYLPDYINHYQFSTLVINCLADDKKNMMYQVFAKETNDEGEYKCLDNGIMSYKDFIIFASKKLPERFKKEKEPENERTKQKI